MITGEKKKKKKNGVRDQAEAFRLVFGQSVIIAKI